MTFLVAWLLGAASGYVARRLVETHKARRVLDRMITAEREGKALTADELLDVWNGKTPEAQSYRSAGGPHG